jgi:hypothetical protein
MNRWWPLTVLLFTLPALAERRAALLVGENAGDLVDAPLRYAESDAEAMRDVLVRIGGISESNAILLRGATAPELRGALASLAARLAQEGWGKSDRLILYVSAHAGNGGLHLRGSHFPLAELRGFLDESPVGVALLILDTCEAGAAVRAKGLVPLSGRVVEIEKPALTGRIVIASSGPEESAFESDEMGGSIFTQHFIAGLRGAADTSRDGRVTLQEAYAYAYARTIESAVASRTARQTPVFDMDLQGAGELVISDLARGQARLTLDVDRPGEWVIASMSGGPQVTRFVKAEGRVVFAIDAGTWRLRTRAGDFYSEDIIRLRDGAQAIVTEQDLAHWTLVPAGRKGTGSSTTVVAAGAIGSGAVSGLGALAGLAIQVEYAFDWAREAGRPILTATVSQLTGRPRDDSFFERELAMVVGGGLQRPAGPVILSAIGEVGAIGVRQQGVNGGAVFGVQPRFDAQLEVAWRFAGAFSLDASVAGGGLFVHTDEQHHLQPFVLGQAGLGWTW